MIFLCISMIMRLNQFSNYGKRNLGALEFFEFLHYKFLLFANKPYPKFPRQPSKHGAVKGLRP